jgi:hypothetical protein
MSIVTVPPALVSASTVLFGQHGDVTRHALQRGVPRPTLYRETQAVLAAVDGTAQRAHVQPLQDQVQEQATRLTALQRQVQDLQRQQATCVRLDAAQQAEFAATAQAEGVSLPTVRRLLQVLLGPATPSVATLGRFTQQAAQRAGELLTVLDPLSRGQTRQALADELFVGRAPVLMVVEPESLCWVSGRLAPCRDGAQWAQELRQLPVLEHLVRDQGSGLGHGVAQVNAERRQHGQRPLADQDDHFHVLREGPRALRRLQHQAARALETAAAADRDRQERARRGQNQAGRAAVAARRWRRAEAAMDQWQAGERAWQRLRQGIGLFTTAGMVNTRAQAEAVIAAVLPQLAGPVWAKLRRRLTRPELLTFLDRVQAQLPALPLTPALREAAVRVEGLRRAAAPGESRVAALARVARLAAAVALARGGDEAAQARAAVRGVLRQAWRASSLVEGVNSVLRMQQARHRRLTQGLLDLKRLYWNCRAFRTGRRKGQTPYQRIGVRLPAGGWWAILQLTPDQLRLQLSMAQLAP